MTGLTRVRNRVKDFLYVLALAMQTTYLARWVQLDMLYDHQQRGTADAKVEVPAQPPLTRNPGRATPKPGLGVTSEHEQVVSVALLTSPQCCR